MRPEQSMIYRKQDNVVTRAIAGETLLVPVCGKLADLEEVYILEGAGAFVWDRLDGKRSVDVISQEVAGEFDVRPEAARKDAEQLLAELADAGLALKVV